MYYAYTHYYFLKSLTPKLDKLVKDNTEITDDLTFNAANFNNTPYFYKLISFGKDKYYIASNYEEHFDSFITECLLNLSKNNDFNALYFVYGMVSSHILDKFLKQMLDAFKDENLSYLSASNMTDYYYAKLDNIDLTKETIYDHFKDAFTYPEYLDELIHYPCIKEFELMVSNNYFKKAYKRKKAFYRRYTKSNFTSPFRSLLYSLKLKKTRIWEYKFKAINDFNILNTKNAEFKLNNKVVTCSSIEMLKLAENEALKVFQYINDYLFNGKDKDIREYFNIPKDKIM